jgi:hypothetical protein
MGDRCLQHQMLLIAMGDEEAAEYAARVANMKRLSSRRAAIDAPKEE